MADEQPDEALEPEELDERRRSAFIDEGTVLTDTWPGTEDIAPVTFSYRPLDAIEEGAWSNKILAAATDVQKIKRIVARKLAAVLVKWDLVDGADNPVPCNNWKRVARLADVALSGIRDIIEESAGTVEAAEGN